MNGGFRAGNPPGKKTKNVIMDSASLYVSMFRSSILKSQFDVFSVLVVVAMSCLLIRCVLYTPQIRSAASKVDL